MPTPIQAFLEVAARHGGVDPADFDAVRRFYGETLPTLAPDRILAVLEDLLAREGASETRAPEPFYPAGAAHPTCRGSPPVLIPRLARGWWGLLTRRRRRRDLSTRGS